MRFMTKEQHLGLLVEYCCNRRNGDRHIEHHNTYYQEWRPPSNGFKFRTRHQDILTGGIMDHTVIILGDKIFVGHADEGEEGWNWIEWSDEIDAEMLTAEVTQNHRKAIIGH